MIRDSDDITDPQVSRYRVVRRYPRYPLRCPWTDRGRSRRRADGGLAALARLEAEGIGDVDDEHLAVAGSPGVDPLVEGGQQVIHLPVTAHDLHSHLVDEVHARVVAVLGMQRIVLLAEALSPPSTCWLDPRGKARSR